MIIKDRLEKACRLTQALVQMPPKPHEKMIEEGDDQEAAE